MSKLKKHKVAVTNKNKVVAKHKILFRVSAFLLTVYVLWRIFFTLPVRYGAFSLVFGVIILLCEVIGFFEVFVSQRHIANYMEPDLPVIPLDWYPEVDVLIATHNESTALLYKTINACTFLEYPDKSKVHICLCDDKDRPEMAALAEEFGIEYYGLSENAHAKAGNLNNALHQTHSPLVVTLDADMIVRSDFLMKTVPFFFIPKVEKKDDGEWVTLPPDKVDPDFKIGFIQTPQAFYNPDLFQYYLYSEDAVPNEQNYFFQEVNVARNHSNAAIYAGSNTVISREALEEIGYIATDTITEDFLTGIRIQKAGYTTYAISEPLANGLAPTQIGSLITQRERWARGTTQTIRKEHLLTTPKLSIWQKLTLLSGQFFWLDFVSTMLFLVVPMASIVFNMRVVDTQMWEPLVFWLPSYLVYNRSVRVLSQNKQSYHWNSMTMTILAPYLSGSILFELLGINKQTKFVVTDKELGKRGNRKAKLLFSLPYALLLGFGIIALVMAIVYSVRIGSLYNPIICYWLIMSIKDLVFALMFVNGRDNVRKADRFYVKLPLTIEYNNRSYEGKTFDISETGLSVGMTHPVYIPSNTPVRVTISYGQYTAHIDCIVMSVHQFAGNWKYGLKIEAMDEENKREYLQIVYDRDHTLPTGLSPNASIFGNLNHNLVRRRKPQQENIRKLPRLDLNLPFKVDDARSGVIQNFNFEYARLQLNFAVQKDQVLAIDFGQDMIMMLKPAGSGQTVSTTLFEIVNRTELLDHPNFDTMLHSWIDLQDTPEQNKPTGQGFLYQDYAQALEKSAIAQGATNDMAEGGKTP